MNSDFELFRLVFWTNFLVGLLLFAYGVYALVTMPISGVGISFLVAVFAATFFWIALQFSDRLSHMRKQKDTEQ
jgi:hypothetical protein